MFDKKLNGIVVVSFLIGTNGRVKQAFPIAYSNRAFVENAVTSVQKWRFQPATVDGKPVAKWLNVPINFSLREPGGGGFARLPSDAFGDELGNLEFAVAKLFRAAVERQLGLTKPIEITSESSSDLVWFRLLPGEGETVQLALSSPSADAEARQMLALLTQALAARPPSRDFASYVKAFPTAELSAPSLAFLRAAAAKNP